MRTHTMRSALRAWALHAHERRIGSELFARAAHFSRAARLVGSWGQWRAFAHEQAQARRKLALAIACSQRTLLTATIRAWDEVRCATRNMLFHVCI